MSSLDTTKKSQYHSALVANSPITVRVVSEPRESKYRKPGESGHLYVKLAIDNYEFAYGAENEACAKPFEGKQGQDVTIEATGRGNDARIRLQGDRSADSGNREATGARPNTQRALTPPKEHQNDSTGFDDLLQQICNAQYLIFKAEKHRWEQMIPDGMVPEFDTLVGNAHFQADCSSAFIKLDRAGEVEELSTAPIWREKGQQEEEW